MIAGAVHITNAEVVFRAMVTDLESSLDAEEWQILEFVVMDYTVECKPILILNQS